MMDKIFMRFGTTLAVVTCLGCSDGGAGDVSVSGDPDRPGCPGADSAVEVAAAPAGTSGTVTEIISAGRYVYVQVDIGDEKIWAAAPAMELAIGEQVTIPPGTPMQDFKSPSLKRTFEVVYFVGTIHKGGSEKGQSAKTDGSTDPHAAMPAGHPKMGGTTTEMPAGHPNMGGAATEMPPGHPTMGGSKSADPAAEKVASVDLNGIAKVGDGMTVEEIMTGGSKMSGKKVKVRGRVVKFNEGILGKNWIHLKDGSGKAGTDDLTVTTADKAAVGDLVVIEGAIATDKDFGYGYKYAIMVEGAKVTVDGE